MKLKIAEKEYDVPHMSVADVDDYEEDLEIVRGDDQDPLKKRKAVVNVIVKFLKASIAELGSIDDRVIKSAIPNFEVSRIFAEMINGPPKDMAQPPLSA